MWTDTASGAKKLKDFKQSLADNPPAEIASLKEEVAAFASSFPTVGYEKDTMRY